MALDIKLGEPALESPVKPVKRVKESKFRLLRWARNRFFTGVIVAIPIAATFLAVSWVVSKIDANVFRIIPARLNPETYLGFAIPGLGLIISVILLFLFCLLYTSPSPRDRQKSRMPSSA